MQRISERTAYGLAAAGGIVIWAAVALLGGRAEAWDSGLYWAFGYPLMLACALLLGYLAPAQPWRWGLTLLLVQALLLVISSGDGSLLPLGLILFGVLALPAMALAIVGAKLRG